MSILQNAISSTPGKVAGVAQVCGVTVRAVYKWLKLGRLPRTDYTGETDYANRIANETGGKYTASEILSSVNTSSKRVQLK